MRGDVLHVEGKDMSVGIVRDGYEWPCRQLGVVRTRTGWNKD